MLKIYHLEPEPKEVGLYNNGLLSINGKKIKTTEEEVIKRYGRGYWRVARI